MTTCSMVGGKQIKSEKKQKKRRNRKTVKGGNVLETAVVPFGLLALQKWFGTRSRHSSNKHRNNKHRNNKTKKYRN
jgi:hypothetical protein